MVSLGKRRQFFIEDRIRELGNQGIQLFRFHRTVGIQVIDVRNAFRCG